MFAVKFIVLYLVIDVDNGDIGLEIGDRSVVMWERMAVVACIVNNKGGPIQ